MNKKSLHSSVNAGKSGQFKELINRGISINGLNSNRSTPLHLACTKNRKVMCKILIDKGAKLNEQDNNGNTPLHIACAKDYKDIAQMLIDEEEVDLDIQNNEGYTPLHIACDEYRWDLFCLLMDEGASFDILNNYGCAPIHIISRSNMDYSFHWLEYFIDNDYPLDTLDANGENILFIMRWVGHVKILIDNGVPTNVINNSGSSALLEHCWHGHFDIVKLLIDNGCPVYCKGGHGDSPLTAGFSSPEICEYFIERGADINEQNDKENTALHRACKWGYTDAIKFLLSAGADRTIVNKKGKIAIECAQQHKIEKIRELFSMAKNAVY